MLFVKTEVKPLKQNLNSSANSCLRHEYTPPSHLELCHRERVKVYIHQVSMLSVKDRLCMSTFYCPHTQEFGHAVC